MKNPSRSALSKLFKNAPPSTSSTERIPMADFPGLSKAEKAGLKIWLMSKVEKIELDQTLESSLQGLIRTATAKLTNAEYAELRRIISSGNVGAL